jgi:hypothetical protein
MISLNTSWIKLDANLACQLDTSLANFKQALSDPKFQKGKKKPLSAFNLRTPQDVTFYLL